MAKILRPDFSQKKEKTIEDFGHGPFSKSSVSTINDAKGITSGKVDNLLKIKMNKSQFYDFVNPNEMNRTLWLKFFDEMIDGSKEEFLEEYEEDSKLEELEIEYKMVSDYLRRMFLNFYDYNEDGEQIAMFHQKDIKDKEILSKTLIYDYLLTESQKDEENDIEEEFDEDKRIVHIGNTYRELYSKRGHKVFKLLDLYIEFFLEKFKECPQVNSLIQAIGFYTQSRIERLVGVGGEDDEYENYWV